MRFEEIVTHNSHIDYLRNAVDHDSLAHALLLWGSSGTGKLGTALALTQYLLCTDRNEGQACGKCSRCVKTQKNIHPDVTFVFPGTQAKVRCSDLYPEWRAALEKDSNLTLQEWVKITSSSSDAKNPQPNIYSAEIEKIIESLSLKSFESGYKVLIVWMAEYLRKEGNKLLKLIEEPPPNTVIILVSEKREHILATIQSRCQQLYFPPLQEERIAAEAERRLGVTEKRARSIAAAAGGSWKRAKDLVDNVASHPIEQVQDWIRACWSNDASKLTSWVQQMANSTREEQKQFAEYLLVIWQKLFWHKWGIDYHSDTEERQLVKWLNTKIEFVEFDELRKLTEDTLRSIERNANGKVLWLNTSLQFKDALLNKHARLRSA